MATLCAECLHLGKLEKCTDDPTEEEDWQTINPDYVFEPDWFEHHASLDSFLAAVDLGCYLCCFIYQEFDLIKHGSGGVAALLAEYADAQPFLKYHISSKFNSELDLDFFPGPFRPVPVAQRASAAFPIRFLSRPATVDDLKQSSSCIGKSTSSEQSFTYATKSLDLCQASHSLCNLQDTTDSWTPTRLLDIAGGLNGTPSIKLRKEIPIGTNYLTLSHSWGSGVVFRLLSTNIETLRRSILVDELSKTFRDALEIVRALNERYIWIDSLCIIQDSNEDWLIESQSMGLIYSRALLNISATAAEDGSYGCFYPRTRAQVGFAIFNCHFRNKSHNNKPVLYRAWADKMWERDVAEARLGKRGWIVQEEILSPRRLLYTSSQLYWQCRETTTSETFPLGVPGLGHYNIGRELATLLNDIKSSNLAVDTRESAMELWEFILRRYTSTDLSYPTDKLIAVAGLVDMLRKACGDDMIFGLWRRNFLVTLFWHCNGVQHDGKPSYRPRPWRAPSWSWASLESVIVLPYNVLAKHLRLLRMPEPSQCTLTGTTLDTNDVASSHLYPVTIEGPTCRIRIRQRNYSISGMIGYDCCVMEHSFDDSVLPSNFTSISTSLILVTPFRDSRGRRAFMAANCFTPDEGVVEHYDEEYLCLVRSTYDDLHGEPLDQPKSSSVLEFSHFSSALVLSHAQITGGDLTSLQQDLPQPLNDRLYKRIGYFSLQSNREPEHYRITLEKRIVTIV